MNFSIAIHKKRQRHRISRLVESNPTFRSKKVRESVLMKGVRAFYHFSYRKSWTSQISLVRKSFWFSYPLCLWALDSWETITLMNVLVSVRFSHSCLSFSLWIGTIVDLHQLLDICFFLRIDFRKLVDPNDKTSSSFPIKGDDRPADPTGFSFQKSHQRDAIHFGKRTDIYLYFSGYSNTCEVQCGEPSELFSKSLCQNLKTTYFRVNQWAIRLSTHVLTMSPALGMKRL